MIRVDSEGSVDCYQGAENRITMLEGCNSLRRSIQQRLKWSDLHLLRAFIVFLESQSWVEMEHQPTDHGQDASLVKHAVKLLSSHFRDQLEAASVVISSLKYLKISKEK